MKKGEKSLKAALNWMEPARLLFFTLSEFLLSGTYAKKWTSGLLCFLVMMNGWDSVAQTSVDLSLNSNWQFRQADSGEWLQATVPGCVHTDLMAVEKLRDPFFRLQEEEAQWVDKQDWEYRKTVRLSSVYQKMETVQLQFKGLDTRANVFWDGKLILEANNAFREWIVPLKGEQLTEGEHILRIYFYSPITQGLLLQTEYGTKLPAINDQSERGEVQGNRRVSPYLRKPPYHFGWDWGPRLVSSGISGDVLLQAWNKAILKDVHIRQKEISTDLARLEAVCTLESATSGSGTIRLGMNGQPLLEYACSWEPGTNNILIPFSLENPRLWWTHDLGEPYLYQIDILLESDDVLLSKSSVTTGLRKIELIVEPDSTGEGSGFRFELNGVPIFAKGANYIPQDIFPTRVTPEEHEKMIRSAVDANMNMIRIWGGGIYEDDEFYDACDQMGILIWQDFMFACSMYPGNPEFLENVREEAIDQVTRLRNHPCIALWCGNNEIDLAWAQHNPIGGWGWKQRYRKRTRQKIWKANTDLFHDLLPEVVRTLHPEIDYWPSSPYEKEGGHSGNKSISGDMHYWGVWHGKHPFSDFHTYVGRFMSEYGFQSFPEFRTVQTYTLPEDHFIESEVMASHQRSGIGNLRIRSYMEDHYQVPDSFAHLLYVGQLLQAKGIRTAIEAHRFTRPYCMGSLYWQLNDCWPVASWSGIDYTYRWKALHFEVKRAFLPVIIGVKSQKGQNELYVSSDFPDPVQARLRIRVIQLDGTITSDSSHTMEVPAQQGWNIGPVEEITGSIPDSSVVYISLIDELEQEICYQIWTPSAPKDLQLRKPDIQVESLQTPEGLVLTLSTDVPALGVWLQTDVDEEFSHNFFDLVPGVPRKIILPLKDIDLDSIPLKITSLYDTLTSS